MASPCGNLQETLKDTGANLKSQAYFNTSGALAASPKASPGLWWFFAKVHIWRTFGPVRGCPLSPQGPAIATAGLTSRPASVRIGGRCYGLASSP